MVSHALWFHLTKHVPVQITAAGRESEEEVLYGLGPAGHWAGNRGCRPLAASASVELLETQPLLLCFCSDQSNQMEGKQKDHSVTVYA